MPSGIRMGKEGTEEENSRAVLLLRPERLSTAGAELVLSFALSACCSVSTVPYLHTSPVCLLKRAQWQVGAATLVRAAWTARWNDRTAASAGRGPRTGDRCLPLLEADAAPRVQTTVGARWWRLKRTAEHALAKKHLLLPQNYDLRGIRRRL